jgi:pimeloyl-ACP methyl ester carboxylesterase
MMLATSVEGYIGCVAALKTLDYRRQLPRLTIPTLFLAGAEDGGAPPAVMREMAEATPHAEFVCLAEAAHIANVEVATAFNATVRNFLLATDVSDEAVARL